MNFRFGMDRLLADPARLDRLKHTRVGLLAHPASITSDNRHAVDALIMAGCNIVRAFGPQHGMRGDVQDNMVETADYADPFHQLPVISLYGKHRYPTAGMLEDLDILIYDLQDIGCRVYTYITTLRYLVEACANHNTALWVTDRPNPAGRPVDGTCLDVGEESFVGSAPIPMRHGLTTGELALFFRQRYAPEADLTIIRMQGYDPDAAPGYGWPQRRPWINPSPNAASLNMARCFPGSVLLEGTTLSEGRGTSRPLEVIGAPGLDARAIADTLSQEDADCLGGAFLRQCYFIPTFHKHLGELCAGLQVHTEVPGYHHRAFKPYRLFANLLKIIRLHHPDLGIWRHHLYEYEPDRVPVDVINGGKLLREWVDNRDAGFDVLGDELERSGKAWIDERAPFLLYGDLHEGC